jgi:hypothetical protein
MNTLPNEIVKLIVIEVPRDSHIYSLPALMLTSKQFNAASRDLYDVKGSFNNALMEYYILLGSKTGIDFAVSIGRRPTWSNIATCLYNHLDDIRDHIADTHGLPICYFDNYMRAIVDCKSIDYAKWIVNKGFYPDLYMIMNYLKEISYEILEIFADGITNKYPEISLTQWTFVRNLKTDHDRDIAKKLGLLNNKGLIKAQEIIDIVAKSYNDRTDVTHDLPALAQLAVEVCIGEPRLVMPAMYRNIRKPLMTSLFRETKYFQLKLETI